MTATIYEFDITVAPPMGVDLHHQRVECRLQIAELKKRQFHWSVGLLFGFIVASAFWCNVTSLPATLLIIGNVCIVVLMAHMCARVLISDHDLFDALSVVVAILYGFAAWGHYIAGENTVVRVAALIGGGIGFILWGTLRICWARLILSPLLALEEFSSELQTLNVNDHGTACIKFVGLCEEIPTIKQYQHALAEQGRMAVYGEFLAANEFALRNANTFHATVAWHRLSSPV